MSDLRDLIDRMMPAEMLDQLTDWRTTTTPNGTPALAATPTWRGAPTEIQFWTDADGTTLFSASLHGGRVRLNIHAPDGEWATPPMPLGQPEDN
jgi:hypothetical protein